MKTHEEYIPPFISPYRQYITIEIQTNGQFNALCRFFFKAIKSYGVNIKPSRSDELLSKTLGFNSRNSIINGELSHPQHSPVKIVFPNQYAQVMSHILKSKHQEFNVNCDAVLLDTFNKFYFYLLGKRAAEIKKLHEDNLQDPIKKVSGNFEEKWLLTPLGWLSSDEFNREKMEINRDVVSIWHSVAMEGGWNNAKPIWTVDDIGFVSVEKAFYGRENTSANGTIIPKTIELERMADRLYKKFGHNPEMRLTEWYAKYSRPFLE